MDPLPGSVIGGHVRVRLRRLLLAISIALVVSAGVPAQTFAAIVADCVPGNQKVMHAVVMVGGANFDAVIGDAMTRQLVPCTAPNMAEFSYPLVLPANMELSGTQIVQLGYIRCGAPAGVNCNNVPNDGKVHFIYTPADNTGGVFAVADFWTNGAPTVGHRYRYKITSEAGRWQMCIKDITAGAAYFCEPGGILQHWGQSTSVWWGTEVQNTNAAMGPTCCNDIDLYWMQYSNPANPNWWVVENASVFRTNQPHPARYHNFVYSVNFTNDGLKSHTDPF